MKNIHIYDQIMKIMKIIEYYSLGKFDINFLWMSGAENS